jgi:hypothetical protein
MSARLNPLHSETPHLPTRKASGCPKNHEVKNGRPRLKSVNSVDRDHFDDCEVVHYTATSEQRTAGCVEFEATLKPSLDEALAVLRRYETATGFADATRTPASLVELLWPGVIRDVMGVDRRRLGT